MRPTVPSAAGARTYARPGLARAADRSVPVNGENHNGAGAGGVPRNV